MQTFSSFTSTENNLQSQSLDLHLGMMVGRSYYITVVFVYSNITYEK